MGVGLAGAQEGCGRKRGEKVRFQRAETARLEGRVSRCKGETDEGRVK